MGYGVFALTDVWRPHNPEVVANVREGQVIGYAYDEYVQRSGEDKAPEAVCLTPCDDDAIGTVKMWHDPATVPAGWQIVSKGRFPVGYDDGDGDYSAVGKAGGFKKHGETENDHPDHAEHTHPIPVCEQATPGSGPFTPSQLDTGSQNEIPFRHTGDADNRPPYEVWVIIQRVN